VRRLYCLEGLHLRSKRPRRNRAAAHRLDWVELQRSHQSWSMNFVADQLFGGCNTRILAIFDNFTRQCPTIYVGQSLKGRQKGVAVKHRAILRQ
jgi:putative transposase